MSKPEPQVEFIEVTPQQAKDWLANNKVNRPARNMKIEQYARDMIEGRWNFTPDPITFDEEGLLINGQHRLNAQVKAGKTMSWVVVREAPEGTQNTMDSGVARSAADTLHLAGEDNAQLMAAIARMIRIIDLDLLGKKQPTMSSQEILETVQAHPSIRRATEVAQGTKAGMTPIAPSVLGAAWWMIRQSNSAAEADQFIHRVITLTGEHEGSPILALSRRANELKRAQQRVHKRDLLAMVIKAWNYDVKNKTTVRISLWSRSGQYETPVPLVRDRASTMAEGDDEGDDEEN